MLQNLSCRLCAAIGLGDAGEIAKSVVPKFGLLAAAAGDANITARYFMPWRCHPSYAVTGAICTGACLLLEDSVAAGLGVRPSTGEKLTIAHPSGKMDVVFDYAYDGQLQIHSAGIIRTARKIFAGEIFVSGLTRHSARQVIEPV